MQWSLINFDVPTAFLQQDPKYMETRRQPLYLDPPVECKQFEDEIWECLKVPYGCSDAPRAWFKTFLQFMKKQKGKSIPGDQCIYTFHDSEGNLQGQLVIHVDDGIMAGTKAFLERMKIELKKEYNIEKFEMNDFKFCGLWVRKVRSEIIVEQDKYTDMVDEIKIDPRRRSQTHEKMTVEEIRAVQSVAGAGNWLATQTRPDLSFDVSELVGLVSHDGTVECLRKANKLVKRMKAHKENRLIFRPITGTSLTDLRIKAYSDASWGNMPGLKSQSGQVYVLAGNSETATHFDGNLIHWKSQRIKRVCRSTFAAETLSAVDTIDQAIFLRDMLKAWISGSISSSIDLKIDIYSDCNSLVESMEQIQPTATEKRLKLDLLSMKENLEHGILNSLTWLDTKIQVADALTKHMDTQSMMQCFTDGVYPFYLENVDDRATYTKFTDAQKRLRDYIHLGVDRVVSDHWYGDI